MSQVSQISDKRSVVYSFKSKWLEPIETGKVELFFRKRAPSRIPERVFFYIGSPISAICGWSFIENIEKLSKERAIALSDRGAIGGDELSRYIGNDAEVNIIYFGKYQRFGDRVPVVEVQKQFMFYPPQNFQQVSSAEAMKIIEMGR